MPNDLTLASTARNGLPMMNWFAQKWMSLDRMSLSLMEWFSERRVEAKACLARWAGAFQWNLSGKLKPATANGRELSHELSIESIESDFARSVAMSGFAMSGLSNWRSHGQWKDSANRQRNYWTASTAPAEILWKMVTDLASFASWHPLISSTNAPYGQIAKPGLIYRVCSRYFPLPTRVFVERVQPGELLSIRLFPFPGLQERVTYRIVSTICGTCVLCSITLSGWLSPIAWPMMKPRVVKIAAALVQAAEQETHNPTTAKQKLARYNKQSDIF